MQSKKIKCVVWDLDNTLWNGILIENSEVDIKENVINVIKTLDERGILQSISSKNEYDLAMDKLKELKIDQYFIYPQINWNSKSSAIKKIASEINIGIDTIAFVDDQEFEIEEVKYNVPEVLCINAKDVNNILSMEEMNPKFVTHDSKNRRLLYMNDIKRKKIEDKFEGTQEEFLSTLNMVLKIEKVGKDDLKRVEELTVRTHQLNATGYTYSYEELEELRKSKNHTILIAQLEDKYGYYGSIGIVLIEKKTDKWILKLMIMSCRVVSRGVGGVVLNFILQKAKEANVSLIAEFIPTDRNRIMYITYKFNGFKELQNDHNKVIFEADLNNIPKKPDYVKLIFNEENL